MDEPNHDMTEDPKEGRRTFWSVSYRSRGRKAAAVATLAVAVEHS